MPDAPAPSPAPAPAPSPITKESLSAAARRDDATMKELLRGGEQERTGQVERVRQALDTMRRELTDEKKEQKSRVARAARDLLDEHLSGVRTEMKLKTDESLRDLEKKISNARAVAVEEERATTDFVSVESVKLEAREIAKELKDGDWVTWAKYAGVAVAAGVATKWIWDHTVGRLTGKSGFVRRSAGWLAGIGGAGLAVMGFSRYAGVGNTLLALGKGAKEGAESGWRAGAGETLDKISDLLGKGGRVAAVKEKFERGEYETEEEYNDALAEALFADRAEIVWEGGVMHFVRAGTTLTLNVPVLAYSLTKLAVNRDVESASDCMAIYVKGVVVYATSFGAVQGMVRLAQTRSMSAAMSTLVKESALWPVQVLRNANNARYYLLTKEGQTYLRSMAGLPGYNWNRLMAMTGMRKGGVETAQALITEWRAWDELALTARTTADAEFLAELQSKCAHIENELAHAMDAVKKARATGETLELTDDVRRLLDTGADARSIATWLKEGGTAAGGADEAAKTVAEATQAAAATRPAANAAEGTDTAVKAATEGADTGTDAARAVSETTGTAVDATRAVEGAENALDWTKALADAKKALLSADATPEAAQAIELAVSRCKAMGMGADDAVKLVVDSPKVLYALSKTPASKMAPIALAFGEHGTKGLQRVSTFVAGLAELGDAARGARYLDPDILKAVAEADVAPEAFARIVANPGLRKALAESDDVVRTIKGLVWLEHTMSVKGLINVGGAVISAAALVMDVVTYAEMRARLDKTIANLENSVKGAGFVRSGAHSFKHPSTGTEIDMKTLERSVDSLSTEQAARVGADAVGLGAGLATVIAPSLALGPVGLAILAVELTVHAGITVAEDERSRRFMLDTPTSVLAMIGTAQTVGKNEKDVIDESSSWLWSDVLHSSDRNDADKRALRKKAFSILFFREVGALSKDMPDVAQDILGSHDPTTFLDEKNGQFWNVDFERVIKPFLAARLFQRSVDKGVRWSEFKDLKIDEGVFDWENIGQEDAKIALREAAILYAQHLREMRYRDERSKLGRLEGSENGREVSSLGDIETRAHDRLTIDATGHNADLLGRGTAFGEKFSSMPAEGSTAVERYVDGLVAGLDAKAAKGDESLGGIRAMGSFDSANPAKPSERINLDEAALSAERGVDAPLTADMVEAIVAKGRGARDSVKDVGTTGGAWYANAAHLEPLRVFSAELQRYPRAADRPAAKAFVEKMRALTENYSWEGASFGGKVSGERNDSFRAAVAAMKTALDDIESHTYHLAPVEREKTQAETVALGGKERMLFLDERSDKASVWIEQDGKTTEYRAVDGAEKRYAAPGGTLICRSVPRMEKGATVYDRAWSYERSPDEKGGKAFYCYAVFDGAPQPGVRVDVPAVKTRSFAINDERALVTEKREAVDGNAVITLVYVTKDGEQVAAKGTLRELLAKHPVGQRRLMMNFKNGTKQEMLEFVPRDGATLLRCQIDHVDEAKSTRYYWKKPAQESIVERRVRERSEGKDDDATVAL